MCQRIVNKQYKGDKTKLQATEITNDCYNYIMDLTTNGVVVTDVIKFVQGQTDHVNNQETKLLHDIQQRQQVGREEGETNTTNGVF